MYDCCIHFFKCCTCWSINPNRLSFKPLPLSLYWLRGWIHMQPTNVCFGVTIKIFFHYLVYCVKQMVKNSQLSLFHYKVWKRSGGQYLCKVSTEMCLCTLINLVNLIPMMWLTKPECHFENDDCANWYNRRARIKSAVACFGQVRTKFHYYFLKYFWNYVSVRRH